MLVDKTGKLMTSDCQRINKGEPTDRLDREVFVLNIET